MTLSGNLDFVPLDEVLRLLTRAGNDGAVEVTNSDFSGRVFVSGKGIGLATTLSDHSFRDHLISSGYVSEQELVAIETGQRPIASMDDDGNELVALVREMTVESIYQIEANGADFQVVKDASSPYAVSVPFDLETVIRDSRERAAQWDGVKRVIFDLASPMTINRDLESDSVELDKEAWRIVSEIGSGASVRNLAGRLGTTEFAIARVAAGMAERGLLNVGPEAPASPEPASDYDFETVAAAAVSSTPVPDPQESWWEEPEVAAPVAEESVEAAPETVSQELVTSQPAAQTDEIHADASAPEAEVETETSVPAIEESADGAETPDGEDADAFLEKVFSELGPGEEEENEGHGLMRRRRMGSILRELGED